MSYKCLDCGEVFDEPEKRKEYRGEFWGTPAYEEVRGCPRCRGDYEELVPCEVCGVEHSEEDLLYGVCEECIEKARYDVDLCFKVGANDTEKVEINCFLHSMFEAAEIESILLEVLKEQQKTTSVDCQPFIDNDKGWFAEVYAEEVKKNENGKK